MSLLDSRKVNTSWENFHLLSGRQKGGTECDTSFSSNGKELRIYWGFRLLFWFEICLEVPTKNGASQKSHCRHQELWGGSGFNSRCWSQTKVKQRIPSSPIKTTRAFISVEGAWQCWGVLSHVCDWRLWPWCQQHRRWQKRFCFQPYGLETDKSLLAPHTVPRSVTITTTTITAMTKTTALWLNNTAPLSAVRPKLSQILAPRLRPGN